MKKFSKMIRRFLALCLCLVLLAGTACAEDMHFLSTSGWDSLEFACMLPDGRTVLTGSKLVESREYTGGWVLCLNPDWTVSWEAVEGEKGEWFSAREAVLLPDGTLAVVFDKYINGQDVAAVKIYTQDGQPTGKEFEIPGDYFSMGATASWLMIRRWSNGNEPEETLLVDWDGKELLRYDGSGIPGGYGWPVGNTDELVLAGYDQRENSHAKIMKLDRQTGKALWETTLDRQLPDTTEANLWSGMQTEDGGYVVLLDESGPYQGIASHVWDSFLVKFDAEGRTQWINGESFERHSLNAYDVFSRNGKIGVVGRLKKGEGCERSLSLVFSWFDAEGKELGITEVNLDLEDFSAVRDCLGREPDEMNPEPMSWVEAVIPAADGLWALAGCCVNTTDSEGIRTRALGSNEYVLVRIPEPGE